MLELREVTVRFGDRTILDGINLCVQERETLVILGASGSGKSTILRVLIGLVRPTAGRVYIDGEDVTDFSEEEWNRVREKMGFVFQYSALFDSMTVGENVAFALRRRGNLSEAEIAARVAEKLDLVGLAGREDLLPENLSGGMKKRVGLARAIVTDPAVVLYDEPTAGLDPIRSATVDRLIRTAQERLHTTSVVVTHELASAWRVADRMAFLHQGKFIMDGPAESFRTTTNPIVRAFLDGDESGEETE